MATRPSAPPAEGAPQTIRTLWLGASGMCASSSSGEFWRLGQDHDEPSRLRSLEPATAPLHCGRWSCARTGAGVRCEGEPDHRTPPLDSEGRLELPDGHDALAIATATRRQCILSASGTVWCRTLPDESGRGFVRFPIGPAHELELGDGLGCARLDDEGVYCWFDRSLLDLTRANPDLRRPIEVLCERDAAPEGCAGLVTSFETWTAPVSIATSARDFAVADRVACVLDESGTARCIDLDARSRVAKLGSARDFDVIEGLPPLDDLAAAADHICGTSQGGEVWCWGLNAQGQLGDGTTRSSETPRPVRAGTFAAIEGVAVAAGRSCIVAEGRALCWGEAMFSSPRPPSQVPGLQTSELRAFDRSTCARLGTQWTCWGEGWGDELLGAPQRALPMPQNEIDVQGMIGHTPWNDCFVDGDRLWCVQRDGQEIVYERAHVVDFDFDNGVCVVLEDSVECTSLYPSPEPTVFPVAGARAVTGTALDGCLVDGEGVARCWEFHWPHDPHPTPVPGTRGLIDVASATRPASVAACGLDEARRVLCWGRWDTIERGREEADQPSSVEVRVMPLPAIEQLVGGFGHVCARDEHKGVWCWGHNADGELGAAFELRSSAEPVQVPGLEAIQLVGGQSHLCALDLEGHVVCWGSERGGLRGRVDPNFALTPTPVKLLASPQPPAPY